MRWRRVHRRSLTSAGCHAQQLAERTEAPSEQRSFAVTVFAETDFQEGEFDESDSARSSANNGCGFADDPMSYHCQENTGSEKE